MSKVIEIQTKKMDTWKAGQRLLQVMNLSVSDCVQIVQSQQKKGVDPLFEFLNPSSEKDSEVITATPENLVGLPRG